MENSGQKTPKKVGIKELINRNSTSKGEPPAHFKCRQNPRSLATFLISIKAKDYRQVIVSCHQTEVFDYPK